MATSMITDVTPLNKLEKYCVGKKIQVKVITCYKLYYGREEGRKLYDVHQEVRELGYLVMDSEGTRIVITVGNCLIDKYEGRINEGDCIWVENFIAVGGKKFCSPADHPLTVLFQDYTTFGPVDHVVFPSSSYKFKSIVDIKSSPVGTQEYLFDVIGTVVGDNGDEKGDILAHRKIHLYLEDRKIECVLWAPLSQQYKEFKKSISDGGKNIVIILHLCKFQAVTEVEGGVSSVVNLTRIVLDQEQSDIAEYISKSAEEDLTDREDATERAAASNEVVYRKRKMYFGWISSESSGEGSS